MWVRRTGVPERWGGENKTYLTQAGGKGEKEAKDHYAKLSS